MDKLLEPPASLVSRTSTTFTASTTCAGRLDTAGIQSVWVHRPLHCHGLSHHALILVHLTREVLIAVVNDLIDLGAREASTGRHEFILNIME